MMIKRHDIHMGIDLLPPEKKKRFNIIELDFVNLYTTYHVSHAFSIYNNVKINIVL